MTDNLALQMEQRPEYHMHGVVTHYSVILLSIGTEGEAYLDEHAPEWREHIRATKFEVGHFTRDEDIAAVSRETLIKIVTSKAGCVLGEKIAEQYAEIAISQEPV